MIDFAFGDSKSSTIVSLLSCGAATAPPPAAPFYPAIFLPVFRWLFIHVSNLSHWLFTKNGDF